MDSGATQESLLPAGQCRGYAEPVLVSACFLGIPCRWHGRRPKRRDKLIARLKKRYVLVPVCPEQLGGMPTPRTGETLCSTGAEVLDGSARIIAPETGEVLLYLWCEFFRMAPTLEWSSEAAALRSRQDPAIVETNHEVMEDLRGLFGPARPLHDQSVRIIPRTGAREQQVAIRR